MSNHDDAMDGLADMLFGKYRFDRNEAIVLAREIEMNASQNLLQNFHPGAIATHDSNTAPTFWGNQEAFKSYVDALKGAAGALAKELEKQPKEGETVMYPRKSKGFEYRRSFGNDAEPISSEVFTKFNELGSTCQTCHSYFRIPGW
jgi:cytochrome c556